MGEAAEVDLEVGLGEAALEGEDKGVATVHRSEAFEVAFEVAREGILHIEGESRN